MLNLEANVSIFILLHSIHLISQSMMNRQVAPPILDAINFNFELQPLQSDLMANHIPLYWLSAGTQEVIQIDWIFEAGIWQEQATAVAQATAALLKNGTRTKNALVLNEALEFYGSSLKVSASNDYTIVTLHSLTKHLDKILPVIKEILTEAQFPESEVQLYQQNALQRLAINLRRSEFVANRHIDAYVFGKDYPYGRFTEAEDIKALSTTLLQTFHQTHYHAANCKIFVSGKLESKHLTSIKEWFGKDSWGTPQQLPEHHFTIQPATQHQHRIINDEKGVQGSIRIARNFITRSHPDFAAIIVMNTVFGGYFGSRLMTNIREEKGYTYGIYSQLYCYQHAGALLIATEASKEVCEPAIAEVYKEMDLMREERIEEEELLLVKNYLLGNILGDLEGPFSIMQRWKNMILNKLPLDTFEKNIAVYKSIQPEQIQTLAQQYLNKEDYYELVVV
jgi:zinc protease